jgi:hypothetical protein
MNQRIVTLFGALAALLIATGLLFSRGQTPVEIASHPTSRDTGDYGLAGAARWLETSGVPTRQLRNRYTELANQIPGRTGNLLVITTPMVYPPHPGELRALESWVRRGNDLLVLDALASRPDWARATRDFGLLLWNFDITTHPAGKEPDAVCGDERPDPKADRPSSPVVLRPHPGDIGEALLAGVREVRIKPEDVLAKPGASQIVDYTKGRDRLTFEWLCDTARGHAALWQFRVGKGRLWVTSYPQLFANRNLGLADNAQLLANLVRLSLGPDGAVIFDDMHQGDSALYDPAAFFRDPRLHASVGLLFVIWLLYLLGYSNRFAPPAPPAVGVTPAQFVGGLGGFLARHLGAAAGAQLLLRRLHADLRRRFIAASASPTVWDALAATTRVNPQLLAKLREENARLQSRRSADLRPLARLIHQVREQLQ